MLLEDKLRTSPPVTFSYCSPILQFAVIPPLCSLMVCLRWFSSLSCCKVKLHYSLKSSAASSRFPSRTVGYLAPSILRSGFVEPRLTDWENTARSEEPQFRFIFSSSFPLLLMPTSSRIMDHVTQDKSSPSAFNEFKVLQQPQPIRFHPTEHLWDVAEHYGCVAHRCSLYSLTL